jgi:hypothetical protein
MKSLTGAGMSLGQGFIYSQSKKQNINTKSSTEAELVGASDMASQMLWTRYFLTAQGFKINQNILYQDNQSAMLLENNGTTSSGPKTRHINIQYFFIKDRVAKNEIHVMYCPTEQMVVDFHTKTLQGKKFLEF